MGDIHGIVCMIIVARKCMIVLTSCFTTFASRRTKLFQVISSFKVMKPSEPLQQQRWLFTLFIYFYFWGYLDELNDNDPTKKCRNARVMVIQSH